MKLPTLPNIMRKPIPSALLVSVLLTAVGSSLSAQTTYYWKEGSSANLASSWGVNIDGTGATPPSMSANDILLTVQDGQDINVFSGLMSVNGTGSHVVLQSGSSFTAGSYNQNISVNMESGSTYEVSSAYSNLTLNQVASDSNFVISGSLSSIREYNYGNLTYDSTSSANTQTLTTTGNLTINQGKVRASSFKVSGTHNISGGVTINALGTYEFGTTSSDTPITGTINVGGDLSNSGTLTNNSAYVDGTLNFTGSDSSQATWGTHSGTFAVGVESNKTVTFNDSLTTEGGSVGVDGALVIADGQSVNADTGSITINGTLASSSSSTGILTLNSNSDITFTDGSVISLALGDGSHATLALAGSGTFNFDADQNFLFLDNGITAGLYENIVTGLDSDPGVSGWTISNSGWTGSFSFDGSNVDLNISAIPEPGIISATLGAIVLGLSLVYRRKNSCSK